MSRTKSMTSEMIEEAKALQVSGESYRSIAADLGVSYGAVARALSRTRTAEEFRGVVTVKSPRRRVGSLSWTLEAIRQARDDQLRGRFDRPVELSRMVLTDDAIFTAYHARVAPSSSIRARLEGHDSTRGASVAKAAAQSVIAPRNVLSGIHGTLVNHGIAVGFIERATAPDGTRVSFRLHEWPLEHVYEDTSREILMTSTRDGLPVEIVHGDGFWIVFRKFGVKPWTQDACILPIGLIWAAHAGGVADWAGASESHGDARMFGELPQGVPLADNDGNLSADAKAFLEMLEDVRSGNVGVGIRPSGSKTDVVANQSNAWQVFDTLLMNREKAAARVYTGTDAILGSQGGAPGIDISALFGIASTKLQGDFDALADALATGLYQPWCAVNYGDSYYAPVLVFELPDADAERKNSEHARKIELVTVAIKQMRDSKMDVTQEIVNEMCDRFSLTPALKLAAEETAQVPLELAPTDVARVVRVREARASQGLPPLGDERDNLFLSELEARTEASAEATAQIKVDQAAPAPTPEQRPA